jgi:amidohydrolase
MRTDSGIDIFRGASVGSQAKHVAEATFLTHERTLQELSRWMYDNPETAYKEHQTSARMAETLRAGGFDVEYPAYGLDTAFEANIGTSGPRIVICAEMDALPDVGQACGHNIIGTAAIGAGLSLSPLVEQLGIRVTVLGTPAEEGHGGKIDLIGTGAFEDAAASMMIHPSTRNIVDPTFLAVQHVDIEFHGKEAHASSSPHVGINALDAAVQAYTNIAALRQHMLNTDRIHGIITAGGSAANIVPSHTAMSWYIRSLTDERLEELSEKVHACFAAAALSTGCTYETRMVGHPYSNIQNDITMVDLFADNSAALGRDMVRTADAPSRSFGSTDMGNVSYVVPSIHPMLDLGASPAVNHQPEFAAFTVTDAGMAMIRDGALAMAWTAIDLAEKDLWSELGSY